MNENSTFEKLRTKVVLTDVQVEEMFGISRHTLRNLRFKRQGPNYLKLGTKAVRYKPQDIEDWLESHRIVLDND